MRKEDFFSKFKNKCPDDEEIQRTKKIIEVFDIKSGDELTKLYIKSDVNILTDVLMFLKKLSKNLLKNMELIPYIVGLYLVTLGNVE